MSIDELIWAQFHNRPGDHSGGRSSISRDEVESMSQSTDDELTSHELTMLNGYRQGYEDRDEVTDLVSGNVNYQDQLRSELSRYAPEGELTIYRGGGEQTGRYGNGSLDRDMAGLFGSGLANPKGGPVTETVVSTSQIRAIGAVNELEMIYDTSGVVASVAMHNRPGDHPGGGGPLTGYAALAQVTQVSPSENYGIAAYEKKGSYINDWLRGKDASRSGYDDDEIEDITYELDETIEATPALTADIMTYRGMSNASRVIGPHGSVRGREFTEPGFTSTSALEDEAENFMRGSDLAMVRVTVTRGNQAIGIKESNEEEIILPRQTRFMITGDFIEHGRRVIDMEI